MERVSLDEKNLNISLPLDSDGFFRRECPYCERQLKWWYTPPSETSEATEQPEVYFCPYCHDAAPPSSWWTKEQIEYMQKVAAARVLGPELRRFGKNLRNRSRSSRGSVNFEFTGSSSPSEPPSFIEPDDMVRLDFPCHPEEPIKVESSWKDAAACPTCGIRYPVELIQELKGNG